MSNSLGHISGADRYGDNWYLHHPRNQSSTLEVRNLAGGILRTISFPAVTTSDVEQGFLWIGGNYFVEKRNLADTTLIQRIDLISHYSFLPDDYIYAMTVHDSLIYIVIEDHMLSFTTDGQLYDDVPAPDGIRFITFVGDKLIAGTNFSTINTVDVNTGRATESYVFPESIYGDTHYPIGGIVSLGDRLSGFRDNPKGIFFSRPPAWSWLSSRRPQGR